MPPKTSAAALGSEARHLLFKWLWYARVPEPHCWSCTLSMVESGYCDGPAVRSLMSLSMAELAEELQALQLPFQEAAGLVMAHQVLVVVLCCCVV
jgi:hypothetical protein